MWLMFCVISCSMFLICMVNNLLWAGEFSFAMETSDEIHDSEIRMNPLHIFFFHCIYLEQYKAWIMHKAGT